MNRREAIQGLLFFSIATQTWVSCKDNTEAVNTLGLKNLKLTPDTIDFVTKLTDQIFPTNGIEMFKGQSAMPHVIKMADTLLSKDESVAFGKALMQLKEKSNNASGDALLGFAKGLNESQEDNEIKKCFSFIKQQTLHYFTTTERYMREIHGYEMAPGRYNACVQIDQIKTMKR